MLRRLILLLALLLMVQQVFAIGLGSLVVNALSCDPLSIEVSFFAVRDAPLASVDTGTLDAYDGDGTLVARQGFSLDAGVNGAQIYQTLQWLTSPQANPLRIVMSDTTTGTIVWQYSYSTDCITRTVDNAPYAYASTGTQVNFVSGEEGYSISVIGVSLDGQSGVTVINLSAEEVATLPTTVEENMLIAQGGAPTYWGLVKLYLLTTGELQVNVGPDAEGKIRVTIYDAIPPTRIYGYEFNVLGG